jgi:FMN phosphatase YigB (HAD superfamily)
MLPEIRVRRIYLLIDTIMFDLDGTLLQFTQEAFIGAYFSKLKKVFVRLDMDPDQAVKAVWAGTKAMVLNDGSMLNKQRFWETFSDVMQLDGRRASIVEEACDSFYSNEFDSVKSILPASEIPARIIRSMTARGYTVVLATNPLFPDCAVTTRLGWASLRPDDFKLITHYGNSTFCKPSLEYYEEALMKIGKSPEHCVMVGNNPTEDMCAEKLGMETFLVSDCLENEAGADVNRFRRGRLTDLEAYLTSLGDLSGAAQ